MRIPEDIAIASVDGTVDWRILVVVATQGLQPPLESADFLYVSEPKIMIRIVILGEDKTKKGETLKDQRFSLWVGLAGFEPAASSSRTKRATKLRYSPFWQQS